MKFVIGAHTPLGAPLTIGSHHYAKQLARFGHTVNHIPYPVTPTDLISRNIYNYGRLITKSILTKSNMIPAFFRHANLDQIYFFSLLPRKLLPNFGIFDKIYERTIFSRFKGDCDVLIIDHPLQLWLLRYYRPKKLIYRLTDIYVYDGAHNKALVMRLEKKILRLCDALVVTSEVILEKLKATYGKDLVEQKPFIYLSNGVDYDHYAAKHDLKVKENTVVFIGAVDFRFDHQLLIKLANYFQSTNFKIIGHVADEFRAMVSPYSNIICTGQMPYEKLADELAKCKVGLLLASNSEINQGRSPMKLYEYGAAGLPVVSSSTPEIESRDEPFIYTYHSEQEAIESLEKALLNYQTISPFAVQASQKQSWQHKASQLINFIDNLA